MKKIYTVYFPDLFDKSPKSEYDKNKGYALTDFVSINKEDKSKFIKEYTRTFKTKLKELLKLEFECEGCGESHQHKYSIIKCKECGVEVCEYCSTYDDLCEKCESNIIQKNN